MPHYQATEENLKKLKEKIDKSTVESFFEEFEQEMREFEAEAREPPIITPEMLAQPEIEVTEVRNSQTSRNPKPKTLNPKP
jgi:hypothetical protein